MSCSGGHLGFSISIKNTKIVEELPMIITGQSFKYKGCLLFPLFKTSEKNNLMKI
jgi:hypothetical protein